MRILRTKGTSYTEISKDTTGGLARGLNLRNKNNVTAKQFYGTEAIAPASLPDYLRQDYSLLVRQTVATLDKVVRKAHNLRRYNLEAYTDRVFLADALWKKLCESFEAEIKSQPGGHLAFKEIQAGWDWKAHPYAEQPVNTVAPNGDYNARIIEKFGKGESTREDFKGRWHDSFWRLNSQGEPYYHQIASGIIDHLFRQDRQINKTDRRKKGQRQDVTGQGLIETRGASIANSARDPRQKKKPEYTWSPEDKERYFKVDVIAIIHADITDMSKKSDRYNPGQAGNILYEHFGKTVCEAGDVSGASKTLWSLHNKTRQYYQKLLKTERFRKAYKGASLSKNEAIQKREYEKLQQIVPADSTAFLKIIEAKDRNAELGEYIRLGKLIAHASDMPTETEDPQAYFESRMDFLSTAEGQSEIKRNEAFTRVWRNSVGLSLQTLKAWTGHKDRGGRKPSKPEQQYKIEDLASASVACKLLKHATESDLQKFKNRAKLVFGMQELSFGPNQKYSRADIILGGSQDDSKTTEELIWTVLRLAGEIRNRTNHFNTKRRFVDVVTGGILTALIDAKPFTNRAAHEASPEVLTKFRRLLQFDTLLQRQAIVDKLNKLEIGRFANNEQAQQLVSQLSRSHAETVISPPKFMNVLRGIQNISAGLVDGLPKILTPFLGLQLDNVTLTEPGENAFKVGVLRELYRSGFNKWLSTKGGDTEFIQKTVTQVLENKKARIKEYKKGKFYAQATTISDREPLANMESLNELFGTLQAEVTAEERINQSYKANRAKQRRVSNWIDEFKRDLFGYFFASYIEDQNLSWIWHSQRLEEGAEAGVSLSANEFTLSRVLNEDWHAQFYAWLYLVPSEDIALLRNQLKKTAVLENKSTTENDELLLQNLSEIDQLMQLYTRVQNAGFTGQEHLDVDDNNLADMLYEDPALFEKVYSEASEDHEVSLAGTRRGLREIQRFGHFTALEGIFKKHKITAEEVEAFTGNNSAAVKNLFQQKNDTKDAIIAAVEGKETEKKKLNQLRDEYQILATETALHNFAVGGARLADHVRLHRLMMRVIGRLTDFTLMWERDRLYVLLGMLYSRAQQNLGQLQIGISTGGKPGSDTVYLKLPEALVSAIAGEIEQKSDKKAAHSNLLQGRISLWEQRRGALGDILGIADLLLNQKQYDTLNRYFGKVNQENPKDRKMAALRKQEKKMVRVSHHSVGKTQIRNDFAHYNVIRAYVNVSYLVNSVRSLLSYDRKLKNAVTQSIMEILRDDGIEIKWKFDQDRVSKPDVFPAVETHLTMMRPDEDHETSFEIPKRSVRYTSMVKALFEHDSGGNRALVAEGRGYAAKGPMQYPKRFRKEKEGLVPEEILAVTYPEY